MAQIPDWTSLPQATPNPSYRRVTVDDSSAQVWDQISNLGTGLERDANEVHQSNVNFARSQAALASSQYELAAKNQVETIRDQVTSGQLPWSQAPQAFDQWRQGQQAPPIDNLDPVGQDNYDRIVQMHTANAGFEVQRIANAGKKQAFADNFGGTLDTLGKLAGMPNADIQSINNQIDAYRPMAIEAGIPAAAVDKTIQDFKDTNWFNQATQRSMQAKDSMPALQQLQHDLTDENGFYAGRLDTQKRNVILHGVINENDALQGRMDRAQEKVDLHAQMTLGRIDQQLSSGIPATPEMWATWQDAVKGTSAEAEFDQRLQDEQTIQNVLREPIDQQASYVQQRQQELMQQGGSVRDAQMINRLATAVKSNTQLMQSAPLLYDAQRNDANVAPLDLTTLGTPDGNASIFKQINDRVTTLAAMRKQYGEAIPMAPLLPQEVAQLSSHLQNATPANQAQTLSTLRGAMDNDDAYTAAMRQIAPHSPVIAIAGSMLPYAAATPGVPADAKPTWYDPSFAPNPLDVTRVLRGEQLLNSTAPGSAAQNQEKGKGTAMPMPPDDARGVGNFREEFSGFAHDLFRDRPQLGDAYYSVYKDAYAALAAEKGNVTGTLDPRLSRQALQIALGNRVQYNGQTISVPPGMDPSQFKGLVQNAVAGVASASNAPPYWADRMSGYGLREIGGLGSGRYQLTMGNQVISLPDGKTPFTIDLHNSYATPQTDRTPAEQTDFLAVHTK